MPAFTAGFIWDDDQLLTLGHPGAHSPSGWWTLWLKPGTADYFPLTSSTLWLEWRLWELNPYGYHVTNVLLHAVVVLLTWRTLARLRIPGAWVAAAIFAVHPVCVESVAWISERKNTISQIFFLLSIMSYLKFEATTRTRTYVASVVYFTLSLLAKTSVVMLPLVLLLLAWWRHDRLFGLRPSYRLDEDSVDRRILTGSAIVAGMEGAGVAFFLGRAIQQNGLAFWHASLDALVSGGLKVWVGLLVCALLGGVAGYLSVAPLRRAKLLQSFPGFQVIRSAPFFLAALALGIVTIYFQYGRAIGTEVIPIGTIPQRMASACFAAGFVSIAPCCPST